MSGPDLSQLMEQAREAQSRLAELQRELTQLRSTVDTLNDKVDENNRLLRKLYYSPCVSMAVPWRKRRIWGGLELVW